jgi:hypothetical protein
VIHSHNANPLKSLVHRAGRIDLGPCEFVEPAALLLFRQRYVRVGRIWASLLDPGDPGSEVRCQKDADKCGSGVSGSVLQVSARIGIHKSSIGDD